MRLCVTLCILGALLFVSAGPVRAAGQSSSAAGQTNSLLGPPPQSMEYCAGSKSPDKMQFTLLRGQHGNQFFAWGQIASGDTERFAAALKEARTFGPLSEVVLCSPGGSLDDGLNMGYIVRQDKLATLLPSGYFCISACNFVFMGGVIRTVEPGAHFMVHMFAFESYWKKLQQDDERNWTPFAYALAFPEAMSNFKSNFNDFLLAYIDRNKAKIASDLSQYQKAHPTQKVSLEDFISLPSEQDAIQSEVLREMALEGDVKEIQQGDAQMAANIAEFLVKMELSLHFLTAFANIPNDAPRDLTPAELVEYNITNTQ